MAYVIGLNGSPRKNKNAATMLDHALQGASAAGARVERVDLADLSYSGCKSCFACKLLGGKSFGKCVLKDDLTAVLDKIFQADAVVISTPIYFGDVPGMVRNLFERLWFPGLTYKQDGSVAYTKRIKVGLLYTMGMPDLSAYENLVQSHIHACSTFLGETRMVSTHDGLQYSNYDLYSGDFDVAQKKKYHEEVFGLDCRKAYDLGYQLVHPVFTQEIQEEKEISV